MSMSLLVARAGQAAADDIRDIRGPIHVPVDPPWALYALIAAGALLLAIAGGRLWQRWRARAKDPYEHAKARIGEAAAGAESAQGDQLADAVSAAVREYVEARFALRAAHLTTEEFLEGLLAGTELTQELAPQRAQLELFLGTCDLAKFGGRTMPAALLHGLCADARRFVDAAESAQRARESRAARRAKTTQQRVTP